MRWVLRIGLLLVVVLVLFGLYTFAEAGEFRHVEPLPLPSCEKVDGLVGAEDMVVDQGARLVIVSSDERTWQQPGGLFALSLEPAPDQTGDASDGPGTVVPRQRVRRLTPPEDRELHPHGISLVPPHADVERHVLFVVNHPQPARSEVRIYDWEHQQLTLRRTVDDPLFTSLNDVAGLDDTAFYATNDHDSPPSGSQQIQDLLQLSRGNVVFFDGEKARVVAEGIPYANGIGLSSDNRELYVASTTEGKILGFLRDPDTGDLEKSEEFDLGTGVDNIEVDRYGALWVAAHPKLLTFLRHASNHAVHSPSEALWIDPSGVNTPPVRPVWRDLGGLMSGSSVVVPDGAQLLFGSVFEPYVLVCERQ